MKIGDKVRFLSEVGGGIVKGFQGKDSTQRIPFGALLDGRNALVMRLRRPDFSAISDAF